MTAPDRAHRLAVRIREVLAALLERRMKDPRLGLVTVTEVRMTPDLREATVFYTVYGDDAAWADTAAALASAKGVLRSEVGRLVGLRFTPALTFQPDSVPAAGRHIEELLARVREADARVAEAARTASPVAGSHPYRSEPGDDPSGPG